ncbi:unnamed protein product [Amoebophrya sp. A25]|nr:unnamed protein product [Amoebophrya sp. A25]|eukprot:GSA25T00016200001.1
MSVSGTNIAISMVEVKCLETCGSVSSRDLCSRLVGMLRVLLVWVVRDVKLPGYVKIGLVKVLKYFWTDGTGTGRQRQGCTFAYDYVLKQLDERLSGLIFPGSDRTIRNPFIIFLFKASEFC